MSILSPPIMLIRKMQRRTALKQLMFVTGGALLLPSCIKNIKPASLDLTTIKVSADHEQLLEAITDTLIPGTGTPGAKDLQLHRFVLRMVDDCTAADQQEQFMNGLVEFDKMAEAKAGGPFATLKAEEKLNLLKELESAAASPDDAARQKPINLFYSLTKDLTIEGYMTAEYVMTQQLHYNMVPGKFQGCIEVKDASDYKTILG
jgi:hypothetical protein